MTTLSHLQRLEAMSIHIFQDVAAAFAPPRPSMKTREEYV